MKTRNEIRREAFMRKHGIPPGLYPNAAIDLMMEQFELIERQMRRIKRDVRYQKGKT